MPKKLKRKGRVKPARTVAHAPRKRPSRALVAALCAVFALTVVGGVSRWGGGRIATLTGGFLQATPTPAPLTLAKEYVYAGGRLVATEEPASSPTATPTPSGPHPTGLVATADTPTQVSLSWGAPSSGGTVDHYVVERAQSLAGPFSPVASPPAPTYADATAAPDTAYLYRVKAVFAGGAESPYSDPDLATTVVFTGDDEIATGAVIRAGQLVKLRTAVNAVRALVGLPAYGWTNADPVSTPASQRRPIYLVDVTDLRAALEGPLTALGRSDLYPGYTAAATGVVVKAAHFAEIKQRVE